MRSKEQLSHVIGTGNYVEVDKIIILVREIIKSRFFPASNWYVFIQITMRDSPGMNAERHILKMMGGVTKSEALKFAKALQAKLSSAEIQEEAPTPPQRPNLVVDTTS